MLFGEIVAVYCENHMEHTNKLCGHNVEFVPQQETHYVSTTKPNRLMLFGETVGVYCENHTEHTDTLCGQNVEFVPHRKHITSPLQRQPVNAVWGNSRCLL
jgi:translation initiation factor IF-1